MIKRERYLAPIRGFYDSDLIKVITGIRRCGKSVILNQIKNELENAGHKCLHLNLEDRLVSMELNDEKSLINRILQAKDQGYKYIFLDEIQNIKGWSLACKTLRLHELSLFITGSNSKLLSSEFIKELSGRYVAFNIKTFVYKELLEYANELGRKISVEDYLIYGGFPKTLEFDSKENVLQYLNELDATIVKNDIIARYGIKKTELFTKLVDYVLLSNARILSANSIFNYIKQQKITASINTIIKYLGYLKEAYLIRQIPRFSPKIKRKLEFYEKIYNEDIGLSAIRTQNYDITHNFENIVYNELVFIGYELFIFANGDFEIDFLAIKNGKEFLIQVAYSVAENKARQRELRAFANLDNSRAKILISNDEFDFSTSTVRHIKFKDFLLMQEL